MTPEQKKEGKTEPGLLDSNRSLLEIIFPEDLLSAVLVRYPSLTEDCKHVKSVLRTNI